MQDRILVVDDMELWRDFIKEALEGNYHVDTAASLEQALDLLRGSEPYQVVITDIGFSEDETNTDGIDLLRAIHTHWPRTMTIAISGRAAVADKARFAREYHALVYLERDVLYDDLDNFVDWVAKGVALSYKTEGQGG